jgi:hypothetical protein
MKKIFLIVFCALVGTVAHAAEPALQAGQYVTEKGWGNLTVSRDKGALKFSIEAMGGNAHSCSLDGEIRDGRAVLEAIDKDKPCVVTFKTTADGIQVDSQDAQICRYYCGMRASFEGHYLKPAAGCAPAGLNRTRAGFKRLYGARDYAAARAALEPVLANCARTLDWLEDGWIRNDLALAQYRMGDAAACRSTLQPLAKAAAESDDDVRGSLPPTDADNWLPIVKAARTNLKLCAASSKK